MSFVYFFKSNPEVNRNVRMFVEFVERQTGDKVKHLCSDNRSKYVSRAQSNYLEQMWILL